MSEAISVGRQTYVPVPPEPWVDRVQEAREYGLTDERRALTVWADAVITRRKRYFMVADQTGQIIHRSRLLGEVLEWLDQQGISEYLLQTEARCWRIAMSPSGD